MEKVAQWAEKECDRVGAVDCQSPLATQEGDGLYWFPVGRPLTPLGVRRG